MTGSVAAGIGIGIGIGYLLGGNLSVEGVAFRALVASDPILCILVEDSPSTKSLALRLIALDSGSYVLPW